jgi:hypothetical protein
MWDKGAVCCSFFSVLRLSSLSLSLSVSHLERVEALVQHLADGQARHRRVQARVDWTRFSPSAAAAASHREPGSQASGWRANCGPPPRNKLEASSSCAMPPRRQRVGRPGYSSSSRGCHHGGLCELLGAWRLSPLPTHRPRESYESTAKARLRDVICLQALC